MTYRGRGPGSGFDPERFFGPDGPLGPRGPLGPGGIFGPAGPFGTGGGWGQGHGHWSGEPDPRARRGRGGGRGRARRGDVRAAILELLQGEPMNGYQLMQGIAEATEGAWAPSSGAVYPALAQLEDEGLVEQVEADGRKAYRLTDAGREAAGKGPSLLWGRGSGSEPDDPWDEEGGDQRGPGWGGPRRGRGPGHGPGGRGFGGRHGQRRTGAVLWKALGGLAMATQAVGQSGDEELGTQAAEVLDRTRRELYRMLAEAEVDRDDERADTAAAWDEEEIADGEIIDD
ncbi:PadR family transcriptional regulator [Ornithinimicrobium avium]|uniref:PadR family transcriptional regulator n=1 Tax=Ornithinimicrobium avium TaxID=2283195 RepID=A0A345NMI4_9MICO|nr:PadR family transcriptional regulator [Ornithinimicrobium avium]AXH96242.1 PadR family transcriptional regulator [Ornithinimicrobium avium]